jgi:Zn-finger protein
MARYPELLVAFGVFVRFFEQRHLFFNDSAASQSTKLQFFSDDPLKTLKFWCLCPFFCSKTPYSGRIVNKRRGADIPAFPYRCEAQIRKSRVADSRASSFRCD